VTDIVPCIPGSATGKREKGNQQGELRTAVLLSVSDSQCRARFSPRLGPSPAKEPLHWMISPRWLITLHTSHLAADISPAWVKKSQRPRTRRQKNKATKKDKTVSETTYPAESPNADRHSSRRKLIPSSPIMEPGPAPVSHELRFPLVICPLF
jgi:hypothetical protein